MCVRERVKKQKREGVHTSKKESERNSKRASGCNMVSGGKDREKD